ncbi:putative sodium-dependent excitatory amino acid transporter glt-6 [Pseudolycoriella hygida]|uniref:Amino acid transporter n=1 Tax=Pseudolycoriella hygida TaxID=35572 RepID=A0A9Q0MP80_9DIPT|nr:putative sodium-dependent excitatory amino acid transporter glt-6 [Pseudolycoriella hygida]
MLHQKDSGRKSKFMKVVKKNLLLLTTLAGVIIGIVLGMALRPLNLSDDQVMLISYPGEIFLRILKMLTLPLLISSLVTVTASLNTQMGGKVMARTLSYFAITSLMSAALGISLTFLFRPESTTSGDTFQPVNDKQSKFLDSFLDLGRNFFPENLFQATFQQVTTIYVNKTANNATELTREIVYRNGPNTLGLVVFCLVFGTISNSLGEKGEIIKHFFAAVFDVLLKITTKVMWLSGLAVCSIITGKLLNISNLTEVMSQLALFMICVILGVFLHQLVMMPAIYFFFLRKNPYKFFFSLREAWVTGFAVASSVVTLPTTMDIMINKLKHDERIAKFVLSLGIYLNTNGTALFMSMATAFIAQLSGVTLQLDSLIIVLVTATALSMAMPAIPSASLVMLLVIMGSIDIDPSNVSLLFAIDWILDRFRTTSNVLDDCFAAAIVEKWSERELNETDEMEMERL